MQLPSEKKMLVFSFRKYNFSITAFRTRSAPYEWMRKAESESDNHFKTVNIHTDFVR